jgi:hypothetical protein
VHLGAREKAMVAGDGGRWQDAAWDDSERFVRTGRRGNRDNWPVMILTPRRSSGGGLRGQRSGGAVERRAAKAWRRRRRKSSSSLGFSGKGGDCGLGKT